MRFPSKYALPGVALLGVLFAPRSSTAADTSASSAPPSTASAGRSKPVDAEITSDTAAQFYELRSPTGATIITRRRLTTTLGAAVYDLLDKADDPNAPTLTFRARLRYDADYGGSAEETAPNNPNRFIPGFMRGPVDLMYGYIEGRRFARGWLGFRLGRQYVTDALGWWSFDGGLVKVTTPYWVSIEAYGGLEQRGGLPFSTPRFERDGIWRGDRSDLDQQMWTSYQPNGIAPAFGAAVETAGFNWLHGRFTYRRVYNTGASNASQFANGLREPVEYAGSRVSQERFGYALSGTLPSVGGIKAGFAYDMYVRRMANMYASVDWYASEKVTLSVDWDYYRPTFDGDSIWNFFMAMPMNDIGVRASWDPTSRLGVAAGIRGRAFTLQTGPEKDLAFQTSPNDLASANYYPSSVIDPMGGANLAARYRIGEGSIGARAVADVARSGDRIGFDVYGERTLETRYVFQARSGVWHWDDQLRPDRDAVSFGYVLAVGYKLLPRSLLLVDFQHDMNRISGQRFRTMLWLTLALSTQERQ